MAPSGMIPTIPCTTEPRLPLCIFIGSSTAQKPTASRLADALGVSMTAMPWWQQFSPGETTLGNLLEFTKRMDLAVFIIARDDLRRKGGQGAPELYVTRDNVVFELGLFAGALGGRRSLMLVDTAEIPEKPTDLEGVTEIRWNSQEDGSFSAAVERIVQHGKRIFDELGLGWWVIRFDNNTVPGRATYGVFEVATKGAGLRARYGDTYYADGMTPASLRYRLRSTWHSSNVTFTRYAEGDARLIVLADAMSQAPPEDPEDIAGKATRFMTLFEVHQTAPRDFYQGQYFDIERLPYYGLVTACRLGNCDKSQAEQIAKEKFGGTTKPGHP